MVKQAFPLSNQASLRLRFFICLLSSRFTSEQQYSVHHGNSE